MKMVSKVFAVVTSLALLATVTACGSMCPRKGESAAQPEVSDKMDKMKKEHGGK